MSAKLLPGDCREVMLDMMLDGEQFDSVITDPPYELTSIAARFGKPGAAPAKDAAFARAAGGFMGKQWDATGISYDAAMWRQAYDLLKPGGYIAAFGGTRTYHRIACAIEDAGFELRDTLMWIFGSGFPKSHDVSKGIDKAAGVLGARGHGFNVAGQNVGLNQNRELRSDHPDYVPRAPATAGAARWSGWGTALKPAFEPIILARKPLARDTVAANVLAYGCGAMNLDACRVPSEARPVMVRTSTVVAASSMAGTSTGATSNGDMTDAGRHPPNVLHDGSPEVLAAFARFGTTAAREGGPRAVHKRASGSDASGNTSGALGAESRPSGSVVGVDRGDGGTAARFFPCLPFTDDDTRFHYSGKANKAERWEHCKVCGASHPARDRDVHMHGLNTTDHLTRHPTVKPLALMRWLATLLTQPGGRILDPFAGTGSTLQAGVMAGFHTVGIERDPEYQADIAARLAAYALDN